MIQLKDGSLLAVYAAGGNIVGSASADGGITWPEQSIIAAKQGDVNMDTPELLQLQDGRIIVAYATRPQAAMKGKPDTAQHFGIRTRYSTDNGTSWQQEQVIYTGGVSFHDGCWEPSLLQLPGGEIQLFFSDETVYTSSNEQNISMFRSFDNGVNWTREPQVISFRKNSRDGMPVPVWLQQQHKTVIAIEDPGKKDFKPYIIESGEGGNWDSLVDGESKRRHYALASAISDSVYAGAPYLRQLASGETILSFQSNEGRLKRGDNDAIMRVAVGDKSAHNFSLVSNPFLIAENYHALWNSLCILKGDTIVALTSTNGFSKKASGVWMIKGVLINSK